MDKNEAARYAIQSVFTTHSRAIHTPFGHDTVIFDEDPLSLLLDVDTLKIADLKKIKDSGHYRWKLFGDSSSSFMKLQRYLEAVEPGEILSLPDRFKIDVSSKWLHIMETEDIDSNIMKFLDSAYFYKDESDRDRIHFINKAELPTDKKIIIMSATIPVDIYKELYGERVQIIDITDVVHVGHITQHTRYSYSRNSLEQRVDEANGKLSDRPTITFKSFNDRVDNAAPDM